MDTEPSRTSLALLTDLYQLTMAYGYWKSGRAGDEAVFQLFFRRAPFGGAYAIACGLASAVDFIDACRFDSSDLAYLARLAGADGRPLFDAGFLEYLRGLRLEIDVDAVPEGTVVFPREPLMRISGPIIPAQILETALLNVINFQTLIATKATRVCQAAQGDAVIEFGLRRAQGIDGGLSASRAAYVGGCSSTSNVLAGKLHGIPVRGTHAHSWVMSFDDESEAFDAYAAALPGNCVFLVDTYDTLEGVRRAAEVGRRLERAGHTFLGVRLDSGDLASLSAAARRLLDEAGLSHAAVVASNDLDEHEILRLKRVGAPISVWGVGTRLVTGHEQAALGGVYKLALIRRAGGTWHHRVKLSDEPEKSSLPGRLGVRRFVTSTGGRSRIVADLIYDVDDPASAAPAVVDAAGGGPRGPIPADAVPSELLVPVLRGGRRAGELPSVHDARRRTLEEIERLPPEARRLVEPEPLEVWIDARVAARLEQLRRTARGRG